MQDANIVAEQIRAARAVLSWSVAELSMKTGVGTATIKRYEATTGVPKSRKGHLQTIRSTFESAGIEFIGTPEDRPGIRLHRPAGP
ncbi:transcriptional regulator [Histidinibacterium lentulum]|uniref:Transcriptional regulator n=1 Tax=Histidinibacterium lentulum TaxID=2480588 RepID=A0A3N2QSC3_9RHOB|nr:transcriptional regulator [Histidinibacterium lentulum]